MHNIDDVEEEREESTGGFQDDGIRTLAGGHDLGYIDVRPAPAAQIDSGAAFLLTMAFGFILWANFRK